MKGTVLVALVACLAVAQAASLAGLAQGKPVKGSFPVKPLTGAPQIVEVEKVIYKVGTDKQYEMEMCVNNSIPDPDEVGQVVIVENSTQLNILGTRLDDKCYLFTDISLPADNSVVSYNLHLYKNGSNVFEGPLGLLKYPFKTVLSSSSFACNEQEFNRVEYLSPSTSNSTHQHCLQGYDKICYLDGTVNITGGGLNSLCTPSQDQAYSLNDMVYCQPGTEQKLEMGTHYTNFLSYAGYYGFTVDSSSSAYPTEAILFGANKAPSVTAVNKNQVDIGDSFAPSDTSYHLCTLQLDTAGGKVKAAYQSGVQDLSVHGYPLGDTCFLNFHNKYSERKYFLTGETGADAISVDCSRIQPEGACYSSAACNNKDEMTLDYDGSQHNIIKVSEADLTASA